MNAPTQARLTRRHWIKSVGSVAVLGATGRNGFAADVQATGHTDAAYGPSRYFRFCLNTSTIRGQNLSIEQEVEIAARAGYDAIEPWTGKLHDYVERGGKLRDLRKRIEDLGLTVESAIGFPTWIVDEPDRRARGFEQAKRDMDVLARIGARRMAAPPAGVPRDQVVDPMRAAERYRQLLELGDQMGVVPQIEMWGGNPTIGRISTAVFIAIESGHSKACFLGDLFHTYKAGCSFNGLRLLGPQALQVYHLNDYPAEPPREQIRDSDRVYPGDGVGPITQVLRIFQEIGARPVLSLELFNRTYWQQDALEVARTGLRKMKDCVQRAFSVARAVEE